MPTSGDGPLAGGTPCSCVSGENGGDLGDGSRELDDRSCLHCRRSDLPSSSSYSSLLRLESVSLRDYDKVARIVAASVKGFSIGAGLKGGLALFAVLGRLRRRRLLTSAKKMGMTSSSEDVILGLKETLRYGLFLGTFAGTFVSVDEIIATWGGHRRTARWRALLAGAIAGPSMLLTGLDTQHTSLAIYILMRAAVLASRCGIKSKRFGHICKPLTWAHGDIFLMCLSSSQILSAYILKQESLPSSYKSFLNKHGGKDPVLLQGIKEIVCGMPFHNLEVIENYYKAIGVDIKLDPQMKIPCSIIHENQSCGAHLVSFLIQAYKRALPVYLPVYLIPALIVHRKGLLKRPYTILGKGLLGTARSSLFLSTYCSSAWMWTCMLFRLFKTCNIPLVAMGTFPPGLALAIEKKSRRIEISLYCLARAIESFFTCMADVGYLPSSKRLKRADVAVFSISTAIIMHCYAIERDVFRSKYLNVLDWVFGVPLPPSETPRKRS
ncbi:Transmembrane protein like [Actinidia chinensis var. chinensis]|uniref:Transmembrane protein like n=1 Tax=Actinidia chinensis var. chinensis TaxID=1590841 RepID=A0A2R6Q0G1_ACTCC|nr:Transmembrane protein like [Actinidia chinensis var. chinensis]